MTKYAHVQGFVEPGFGPVAEAFERNFTQYGELGAAFALYVDGQLKVDVWGGVADKASGRAWTADTLQLVFSCTKGAAAACVAHLVDRGRLAYTDRVAEHWPEFAAHGKREITVEQLLSHQAGLLTPDRQMTFEEVLAGAPVAAALADTTPLWTPGTAHGYHALTFGWLAGELVRRVDGRPLGRYFADEIAGPLGLEFWIGLPESEQPRVSTIEPAPMSLGRKMLALAAARFLPDSYLNRALSLDGAIRLPDDFNLPAVHRSEMPGAGGICTARSMAKLYAGLVGEVDGVRLVSPATVDAARRERVDGYDLCFGEASRFGAGFQLRSARCGMIREGSFGHTGAGGALGYANPELGIGFAYVMNQMSNHIPDPRTVGLSAAVAECV